MTMAMTRSEYLQWCKDRACELLDKGEVQQAFESMCSDVMKHPKTMHHQVTNMDGRLLLAIGVLDCPDEMRKWINGYR